MVSSVLGERITRQGFAERPCSSVAAAVALTTAIQAQDAPASRLGVRARAAGVTEADVLHAIAAERTVVRTWLMRGTIHLVDTADLRWLVRLLGPSLERKFRTRWRQLGLTDTVLRQVTEALPAVLADGPLRRRDIRLRLAEVGVGVDSPDPQAHSHALFYASTIGLICRGADVGRDTTFALLDEWVPDAPQGPSGDAALAELARRYFAAFGPATAHDFGVWSGLAAGRAVALIREELTPVEVDGRPGWRLGPPVARGRGLRLLPAYDNYLVGYKYRDPILAAELRPEVYVGGIIRPSVVLDGRVIGTWTLDRARGRVTVSAFETYSRAVLRAVEAEVADIARFVDRDLQLAVPG